VADGGKSSSPVDVVAPFFLVLTIVLIFLIASIRSCYYPYPPQPPKDKRKYISQPYYTVTVGSFGSNASASQRAEELRAERVNNFVLQEGANGLSASENTGMWKPLTTRWKPSPTRALMARFCIRRRRKLFAGITTPQHVGKYGETCEVILSYTHVGNHSPPAVARRRTTAAEQP
jgi:hypothetical protein